MVLDNESLRLADDFKRIGTRLFAERLVGGNFGNMSTRCEEGFFITRPGSFLDAPGIPVFVPLIGDVPPDASSEYRVHRKIYQLTDYRAVIHAHPPYAISCAFIKDRIEPIDCEGIIFSPVISVVEGACGSEDLAVRVAHALMSANVVIARGHGTFAAGKNLDEAFIQTSLAEHSCRILLLSGK